MCGLAGRYDENGFRLKEMRSILDEIGIRGLHSTGVSWREGGEIKTVIENVPYFKFNIPDVETDGAIFHCRYSTSNIDYPQPVHGKTGHALVHNGVITQKSFNEWEKEFGYTGNYKCDSILLAGHSGNPFEEFPESSMAAIELYDGEFVFYRNGQRPLHYIEKNGGVIVASTASAFPGIISKKCKVGVMYDFHNGVREVFGNKLKDLQL